jgi:hypothetical protein
MISAGFYEGNRRLLAAGAEVPTAREQDAAMMRLFEFTDCRPPFWFNLHRYGNRRNKAA